MPTIGFEEVRRHNGPKSCWMVIRNDIYDVTKFLDSHPGGASSLLDFAGKDGTLAFESVGHSEDARSMMSKYKIGTLPLTEHSSHYKSCIRKMEPVRSEQDNKFIDHRMEYMVYNVEDGSSSGLPKARSQEKTWRTFDGTPQRSKIDIAPKSPKSGYSTPKAATPRIEPRVKTVVVPRESSAWKWALLALGVAIIVGVALKKYGVIMKK